VTVETSPEANTIHFPGGIPGFPHLTRFALVEIVENGAFQLLQSLEDEDVAMVVCVPWLFFPDYAPNLSDEDQEALGLERPEDAVVFCPVTIEPESDLVHLNLLGPFVVHRKTLIGRQVVLADSDYPLRATVDPGAA
jgi:flagellar assembly factor FliW